MEKEWESWLLDIVSDLPHKDTVIADLKKSLIPHFNQKTIFSHNPK
jgi:hypothetical protein